MKVTGSVIIEGTGNDKNTYQLEIEDGSLYVLRNFKGDTDRQDRIPSGWRWNGEYQSALCIDGGLGWFVCPKWKAWKEVEKLWNVAIKGTENLR